MTTLLASIIGFFSSIIPELIKIFKDYQDKKHELRIFDKQVKFSQHNNGGLFSIGGSNDKMTHNILSEFAVLHQNYKIGINWVDALNASVRPVLAYCFFLLYAFIKFTQYNSIKGKGFLISHLSILWSLEDQAIFASILSFYFGQRTFRKLLK